MKPARLLFGGVIGFSLLLTGCGESAGVESLSPQEIEEYLQANEEAYILLTRTFDDEERKEQIELVDEINDGELEIKEINAQHDNLVNSESSIEENIGLQRHQLRSLGYVENNETKDYVYVNEASYSSDEEREAAIQTFINQEAD